MFGMFLLYFLVALLFLLAFLLSQALYIGPPPADSHQPVYLSTKDKVGHETASPAGAVELQICPLPLSSADPGPPPQNYPGSCSSSAQTV